MTTKSLANQIRTARSISLSAVGVAGIISVALWILIAYLSDIPRMIAASLAQYIGIMAQ